MKRLDQPARYAHQRRMTTQNHDQLSDLAAILAAGLQRLSDRKSSQKSPSAPETPLDCRALSDGHVRERIEDVAP
jgi:hypothetical protein